jgi:hypothetical protein
MDSLPIELFYVILEETCIDSLHMILVCKHVCKSWYKVLKKYTKPNCDAILHDAVKNNHLEVIKWLRQIGCPWSKYTCNAAAFAGNLEMLRFLIESGCPKDNGIGTSALTGGDFPEILEYCYSIGSKNLEEWIRFTIEDNRIKCFELIMSKYSNEISEKHRSKLITYLAASHGKLDILQSAKRFGCGCSPVVYARVISGGYRHIFDYLRQEGVKPHDNMLGILADYGCLHWLK